MRQLVRGCAVTAAGVLVVGLTSVVPAQAAPLACGQVITTSTTLTTDVGPCPHNGIVVGTDNVVLNLAGHHLFGTPQPGDGAGVLLLGRRGVTVENGTVTDFDGGVVVNGGGGNTVRAISARNNIGSSGDPNVQDTDFGDGIVLEGSSNNVVTGNTAVGNGPFSGIGLITQSDPDHPFPSGPTSDNRVIGNIVTDNIACRFGPFCDNDGIRLEPGVGPNDVVLGNVVKRNGLDGISLFADTDHNTIRANMVSGNGFHGAVPGDGIRVFASANLISGNVASGNAAGGISVGRRPISPPGSLPPNHTTGNPRGKNNQILGNSATGNGIIDLYDSNPSCDNNRWTGNNGPTFAPPCTKG